MKKKSRAVCLVCYCVNGGKKDTQIGFCLYKQLLAVVFGVRGLVPTHSAESYSGQIIVRHPSPTSGTVLGL